MKAAQQKFTEAEAAVILAQLVRENPGARLVDTSTEKTVVSRHGRKIAKLISDGHGMWVIDSGNITPRLRFVGYIKKGLRPPNPP